MEIKLKDPQINEYVFADEPNKVGKKQDGFQNKDVKKFHISELSEKEAEEYAERYKTEFLRKYNSFK